MREQAAQLQAEADELEAEEERLADEEEREQLAAEQAQWGTLAGPDPSKAPARPKAAARKMSKPDRLVAWLVCAASLGLTTAAVFTVPMLKPQLGPSLRVSDLACLFPTEAAQLVCSGDMDCISQGAALLEGNAVVRNALCPKILLVEATKLSNMSWLKPAGETVAAKTVMAGYGRALWIQLLCLVAFYASILNMVRLGRHGTGFIGTVLAAAGGLILAEGGNVPIDAALLIIGLNTLAIAAR